MRAVIQRVTQSEATVDGKISGQIGPGLLVFLGVGTGDRSKDADYLANKITRLRIFEDDNQKMNRSLLDTGGQMLVVSQFTLLSDCRKGRRPSFVRAAPPDQAEKLYFYFVSQVRNQGVTVETGKFRTMMAVSLVNEGPVTLILDSPQFNPD
jgi:D-tyrosyl-tRNA(Tyr) deacylase